MATRPGDGPTEEDLNNPGPANPNPAGVSTDEPAEGGDDVPEQESGSPEG